MKDISGIQSYYLLLEYKGELQNTVAHMSEKIGTS